jgi:hypothetical protein
VWRAQRSLPPTATEHRRLRPVRGVQQARIGRPLLDHCVGEHEQGRWDAQPERLGGLHVDDQLDACELLDREVGRPLTLENPAGLEADEAVPFGEASTIGHHAAGHSEVAILIDRGYPVPERQRAELFSAGREE